MRKKSGGTFASRHGIASDDPSLMVFDHCPGNAGQWQPRARRLARREDASPPLDSMVGHAEGKVGGKDIAAFAQRLRAMEGQIEL